MTPKFRLSSEEWHCLSPSGLVGRPSASALLTEEVGEDARRDLSGVGGETPEETPVSRRGRLGRDDVAEPRFPLLDSEGAERPHDPVARVVDAPHAAPPPVDDLAHGRLHAR